MEQDQRLHLIESGLARTPDDPFLRYAYGLELANSGREDEACTWLGALMGSVPAYLPLYFQYGRLLGALGRRDEALGVLQRGMAVALVQRESHAHNELTGLLELIESGDVIL